MTRDQWYDVCNCLELEAKDELASDIRAQISLYVAAPTLAKELQEAFASIRDCLLKTEEIGETWPDGLTLAEIIKRDIEPIVVAYIDSR